MPDKNTPDVRLIYPEFFTNPAIRELSPLPIWTVSDKEKCPINITAFIKENRLLNKKTEESLGYNPLATLQDVVNAIPNSTNFTMYLDAGDPDRPYVMLDVEPSCPDPLKERFLHLPFIYGEVSMSGKGYHLLFPSPDDLFKKYPNAATRQALVPDGRHYEILVSHPVMLTRRVVHPKEPVDPMEEFRNIFEALAAVAVPPNSIKSSGEDIDFTADIQAIPNYRVFKQYLLGNPYRKTPKDFLKRNGEPDYSSYEYGMASSRFHMLHKILPDWKFKDHKYTHEEIVLLIYDYLKESAEPRPKHTACRNGMPWLCYIADTVVARKMSELQEAEDKKGGQTP